MPILLDTCAAIWFAEAAGLRKPAADALDQSMDDNLPLHVSAITAWEIGILASKGRISLPITPQDWFEKFAVSDGIEVASLEPALLIDSSFLPGAPPADPADRIIVATARRQGLTVMTRDREILNYADAGHVRAIEC